MINLLTVDVEDWYHANALNIPIDHWAHYPERVVENTKKIIDLFDKYDTKATFFILGSVAEQFPSLIKEIARKGHEIASHGQNHQLVYTLTDEEFRKDVRKSKVILEDLTGKQVRFYRAPSWSISMSQIDRLIILEEEGYEGDSSLQPFRTPLSGSGKTPCEPFYPIIQGRKLKLLEVPPTVLSMAGLRLPFSGGFYLRFFPSAFVQKSMAWVNHKRKAIVYVHPWEFDMEMPVLERNWFVSFIHYYNISSTYLKMERLLNSFSFVPMENCLKDHYYPSISLRD